jgi:hypothetical protein
MAPYTGGVMPPVRTGLAVAALVTGILALTTCPPLGIASVILGIVALVRTDREPTVYGGKGLAIAGLVCGAVGLFCVGPLLMSILLPSLSRARELSKRLVCGANLKSIGTAMLIYANDYPGQGTPSIQTLIDMDLVEPKQAICPSSSLNQANYVVVQGARPSPSGNRPLVFEPISNHGDEGGNVVFEDGSVDFLRREKHDEMRRQIESSSLEH